MAGLCSQTKLSGSRRCGRRGIRSSSLTRFRSCSSFGSLERPELVKLFKAVLRGESIAADDWDWESLEPDQETEAPSSSEAADAAAFAARRDDGAEWEEAAFNSLDD